MTDLTMAPVARVTLVDTAGIDAQPWLSLDDAGDVQHKVLWRHGDTVAGMLKLSPGGAEQRHTHLAAHHHMWVVDGQVSVGDVTGETGSYLHVPAGVPHATTSGPDGCTMFYLYEPSSDI